MVTHTVFFSGYLDLGGMSDRFESQIETGIGVLIFVRLRTLEAFSKSGLVSIFAGKSPETWVCDKTSDQSVFFPLFFLKGDLYCMT